METVADRCLTIGQGSDTLLHSLEPIGEPMERTRNMNTPAEQFAQDWLLIMENNDEASYAELMELAESKSSDYALAETLRDEWEYLCQQIQDLISRNISPFTSEIVNQQLNYWGIEPFMIIARDLRERVAENASA